MTKVKNLDIVSGTEAAYQKEVPKNTFEQKWNKHKKDYIQKNSTKDMVYENGSALALLYREVMRLNDLLTNNLKQNGKQENKS
jgi:hypothetical protein